MTFHQEILEELAHPDEPQVWADPRKRVGPSLRDRLMSGVRYRGECWIVVTQPSQKYPKISIRNQMFQRSRVMFYLTHQRDPVGGVVRHSCDEPLCINPSHLLEGTHSDNTQDMLARNRHNLPARKTHCLNGHERTPDNLYGGNSCKMCAIDRSKARDPALRRITRPHKKKGPAKREVCGRGHKLEEGNLIISTDAKGVTHRQCRECVLTARRNRYGRGT